MTADLLISAGPFKGEIYHSVIIYIVHRLGQASEYRICKGYDTQKALIIVKNKEQKRTKKLVPRVMTTLKWIRLAFKLNLMKITKSLLNEKSDELAKAKM